MAERNHLISQIISKSDIPRSRNQTINTQKAHQIMTGEVLCEEE